MLFYLCRVNRNDLLPLKVTNINTIIYIYIYISGKLILVALRRGSISGNHGLCCGQVLPICKLPYIYIYLPSVTRITKLFTCIFLLLSLEQIFINFLIFNSYLTFMY